MKLKKILAGTLTAAMVLTSVPVTGFPVFAETEGTDSTASIEYAGEIDQSVLAANAKDNSHDNHTYSGTPESKDGSAELAFDTIDNKNNTRWHQNYSSGNSSNYSGSTVPPASTNPIWIQTSFGVKEDGTRQSYKIGKLTYLSRPGNQHGQTRIEKYAILVANVNKESPEADDWMVVKSGTMSTEPQDDTSKVFELTFTPVEATHVRLVAISAYNNANFVCAGDIHIYKVKDDSVSAADVVDIQNIKTTGGKAVAVAPGVATLDDRDITWSARACNSLNESPSHLGKQLANESQNITLIAVPNTGYTFKEWQNTEGRTVSNTANLDTTTAEYKNYVPVFEKNTEEYAKISVLPSLYDANNLSGTNPSNIRSNSQKYPCDNNDGPAWWAFYNTSSTKVWHSRWGGSADKVGGVENIESTASGANGGLSTPIWVEVRFPDGEEISRITVERSQADNYTAPKDYQILVANTDGVAKDDDFVVTASGTFTFSTEKSDTTDTVKTIDLPKTVKATHIRLKILSGTRITNGYIHSGQPSVANIALYTKTVDIDNDSADIATVVSTPKVTSNDTAKGTVTKSIDKMLDTVDTAITMTATPTEGYRFAKWIVTDLRDKTVTEKTDATLNETINTNQYTYQAIFVKDGISVSLNQSELDLTAGGTQALVATVGNDDSDSVTWTTSDGSVATVDDGRVTAVDAGTATIIATSVEDPEKTASCTVRVTADKTELNTLLTKVENIINGTSEEKYTNDSKETLKTSDAYTNAQAVAGKEDAKTAEVTDAYTALEEAVSKLVRVYCVTFNVNGGEAIDSIWVTADDDMWTLPTPSKTDYVFKGWYKDGEYNTPYTEVAAIGEANLNLYAKWESEADHIAIFTQPEKVVYFTGESFDAKGMKVTLTRKDATSVELLAEDYTIEPITFEKEGKQNVTVTYTAKPEHTATVAVKVINKKAKEDLEAVLEKAEAQKEEFENGRYTQTSKNEFNTAYANAEKLKTDLESFDSEACDDAHGVATALAEAIDGMEKLCKVSVSTGATITAEKTETEIDNAGNSFVYVEIGTKVTISASATSGEKTFTGWKWNDNVISTSAKYTLYAVEDMEITPSYEANEKAEEVKQMFTKTYKSGKHCFIAKRSVPKTYKVSEYGVVITDKTGWDYYKDHEEAFKKGATRTKWTCKTGSANNGTFEARLSGDKSTKYYAKAYVTYTYTDAEGKHTVTEYTKGFLY